MINNYTNNKRNYIELKGGEKEELKELKFIHITKNAGTSIEEAGIKHKIEWGKLNG